MNILTKASALWAVPVATVLALSLFATPALAESPVGCTADNSVVNIAGTPSTAVAGDVITFTVTAGNPVSADGCDITGRTMTLTLPNGVQHVFGPNNYPNPSALAVAGSAPYVANNADAVNGFWTANVSWNGTLKAASDLPSDGNKNASVVQVLPLTVVKTVNTTFDRDWDWTINKTGSDTNLNLQEGEQVSVNYTVVVAPTSENINHAVSGNITITNPVGNPSATVATVTDVLNVSGAAVVDCPGGLPQAIAAGASLVCTYTMAAASATDTQNTATVITTGSVPGGNDSEAVSYGSPVNETDECITVDDTNPQGPQGVVICQNTADKSLEYSVSFGPQGNVVTSCGQGDLHNVADFVTNDNLEVGSDIWDVHWTVNCSVGCTLTQGYWKTHNASFKGGAPVDAGWELLAGGLKENTLFFATGKTWFAIFNTPPKGNVYFNLAHQYMAAKLNILNGASPTPAVSAAITSAEALFTSNSIAQAALLKGGAKTSWTNLAGTLGSFNEGLIGPGHCDEQIPN